MEEKKLSLVQSWVKFSRLLFQLKKTWDEHTEIWLATPRDEIERLPVEYQKFLARNFNRSKFDIMLPRLVDYWRGLGGIEALRVVAKVPSAKEILKRAKESK